MSRNVELAPVVLMNNPALVAQPDPLLARAAAAWMAGAIDLDPFRFTLTWNTLLASAVGQEANTSLDAGIDLLLTRLNLTSYSAAGTIVANPDYLLEIFDGSGPWQDAPHHVMLWTGQHRNSGSRPGDTPMARYVRGSNVVKGKLTNNTATAARVDLGLEGWRISYRTTDRAALFGRTAVPL